jgi:hypothetical protein
MIEHPGAIGTAAELSAPDDAYARHAGKIILLFQRFPDLDVARYRSSGFDRLGARL